MPAPMQIPATLSTATVSPCLAILVSREALPFKFVPKEEKTSDCRGIVVSRRFKSVSKVIASSLGHYLHTGAWATYRVIERVLIPRVVMDIDRHVSECGNFGREGVEERIVLPRAYSQREMFNDGATG